MLNHHQLSTKATSEVFRQNNLEGISTLNLTHLLNADLDHTKSTHFSVKTLQLDNPEAESTYSMAACDGIRRAGLHS